ncbi:MAG: AAA family ATPase [Holosporales bacterium]|jgi:DNA replication and repair protein RecF|nr:AAA family ATPase [Holosporales bacterium]
MDKYLLLNNFRNHEYVKLDLNTDKNIFVITGENGVGKTNILEAISMFSGTRGLRHSNSEDIVNENSDKNFWSVTFSVEDGIFVCGYSGGKRIYKVSDKNVRNLSAFSKNHHILWMTYETDRLFVDSPSKRRNFIDMFASSKFHDHENNIRTYEKLARERLKILKQTNCIINESTNKWLSVIENRIVNIGIKIEKARRNITNDINNGQDESSDFPRFHSEMSEKLNENEYKNELFSRRQKDFFTNSTTYGPNRLDFVVTHSQNNIEAGKCSAGEQKILLLGIFLSFIKENTQNSQKDRHLAEDEEFCKRSIDKKCLILLFDDVIAHLDSVHRVLLFKHIEALRAYFEQNCMNIMIWLSGIDRKLFEEFNDTALFIDL